MHFSTLAAVFIGLYLSSSFRQQTTGSCLAFLVKPGYNRIGSVENTAVLRVKDTMEQDHFPVNSFEESNVNETDTENAISVDNESQRCLSWLYSALKMLAYIPVKVIEAVETGFDSASKNVPNTNEG